MRYYDPYIIFFYGEEGSDMPRAATMQLKTGPAGIDIRAIRKGLRKYFKEVFKTTVSKHWLEKSVVITGPNTVSLKKTKASAKDAAALDKAVFEIQRMEDEYIDTASSYYDYEGSGISEEVAGNARQPLCALQNPNS